MPLPSPPSPSPPPSPPRVHIIGRKNHGKTTLVVELIEFFTARGLRVAAIKHSPHEHEIDRPGSDSDRHRHAGAAPNAFVTSDALTIFIPRGNDDDPYQAIKQHTADCDFIIVEGDQWTSEIKIEVWRAECGDEPIAMELSGVAAIISDDAEVPADRPVWRRGDITAIGERILGLLKRI